MEDVRNWLRSFGLLQYAPQFMEDGWDKLQDLFEIDDQNLTKCINKPGHRKRFTLALAEAKDVGNKTAMSIRINKSSETDSGNAKEVVVHPKTENVERWLKRHGLGQYFSDFTKGGWDIPEVLPHMDPDDIDACIHKPSHRKKFELALKENNFEKTNSLEEEIAVTSDVSESPSGIEAWLKSNDLEQYIAKFKDDGWDTMELLFVMAGEDIKLCIHKPGHIKRFQRAIENEKAKKGALELSAREDYQEEQTTRKHIPGFDDQ